MKKTAVAPSNIAFIKYWGKKDDVLRLPSNGSLSMNLSGLTSKTTVEFNSALKQDDVVIDGVRETTGRVTAHLNRIRKVADLHDYARVASVNSFPASTGLSSSASGFAALTVAASAAAGLNLSEKDLSILARKGSGSACRSIPDGFVEWLDGDTDKTSYAVSIGAPDAWDITDVVAVVSNEKKDVATTAGQKRANSSIFFPVRLSRMKDKIELCKRYIREKRFPEFGDLIEEEALELHAIMLTSHPSLLYWLPTTVLLMREIRKWRREGLMAYFTVNTGQDVHIICRKDDVQRIEQRLKKINEVKKIIVNQPAKGARLTEEHLF